jgi:hypothetical protein
MQLAVLRIGVWRCLFSCKYVSDVATICVILTMQASTGHSYICFERAVLSANHVGELFSLLRSRPFWVRTFPSRSVLKFQFPPHPTSRLCSPQNLSLCLALLYMTAFECRSSDPRSVVAIDYSIGQVVGDTKSISMSNVPPVIDSRGTPAQYIAVPPYRLLAHLLLLQICCYTH